MSYEILLTNRCVRTPVVQSEFIKGGKGEFEHDLLQNEIKTVELRIVIKCSPEESTNEHNIPYSRGDQTFSVTID